MNADRPHGAHGFTLIEVLVALAIVAFGLIAVFGQMSQSAAAASRLRDKTLASWVALNEIAQLRLSGEYPAVGTRSDEVEMANQRWHYEIRISETDGDYLRRADVTVAFADDPQRPLASVAGFLSQPQTGPGIVGTDTGWPRLTGEEDFSGTGTPPPPTPSPTPSPNPAPAPQPPPEDGTANGAAEE